MAAASGHASGEAVVAVTVVFTALAVFVCALRLYARFAVASNAGADDALILVSLLFAVGTTVCMIIQVNTGMGRHQWDIEPHESVTNLKAFYVSIWIYNISLTCTKTSILFQYLRIFPQRPFRITTWTLMGIIVVYGLYVLFTAIFSCWPIAFFWDHSIPGGKCLPRFAIWFLNTGLNIATDIATAVLPLPMINQLELPRRQKRGLMLVFALGGFTCLISVLRIQSLYVIANTKDVSWNNGLAAIWSNVEMNTAILCSCLPTLRCIFPKIFKSNSFISDSTPCSSGSGRGAYHPPGGSASSRPTPSFRDKFTMHLSATNGRLRGAHHHHHHHHHHHSPYRSYSDDPHGKPGGTGTDSLQELEYGLTRSTTRASEPRRASMREIELAGIPPAPPHLPHDRIHVTTAIEQQVHDNAALAPAPAPAPAPRHPRGPGRVSPADFTEDLLTAQGRTAYM